MTIETDRIDERVALETRTVTGSPLFREALPWLLVLVLGFLAIRSCGQPKPPATYELTAETKATLARFDVRLRSDSVRAVADSVERVRLVGVALQASRDAFASRQAAALAGRRADSLAAAEQWQPAYVARTTERDTLLRTLDAQVKQIIATDAQVTLERDRAARAEATLADVRAHVIPQLRAEIDSAYNKGVESTACSIGPRFARVKCPTRTVAAIGGAVLGSLLVVVVHAAVQGN